MEPGLHSPSLICPSMLLSVQAASWRDQHLAAGQSVLRPASRWCTQSWTPHLERPQHLDWIGASSECEFACFARRVSADGSSGGLVGSLICQQKIPPNITLYQGIDFRAKEVYSRNSNLPHASLPVSYCPDGETRRSVEGAPVTRCEGRLGEDGHLHDAVPPEAEHVDPGTRVEARTVSLLSVTHYPLPVVLRLCVCTDPAYAGRVSFNFKQNMLPDL